MLDIEILRLVWWMLLGVLVIGFALTDGFDLGAAILMPLITRNETERRLLLATFLPVWEGNQVWMILAAGALFAAWPYVYAVAFSGFYLLVLLLLLTMGIMRPVSFKYRSKLMQPSWRRSWDVLIFIGGLFPALILGIMVGNVIIGLPYYFDETLRLHYSGTFLQNFSPFALWCGLLSVAMLIMHGGLYLANKTQAPLRERAIHWSRLLAIAVIILFAGGGFWVNKMTGFVGMTGIDPMGPSNPLHKEVIAKTGAWLDNYHRYPLFLLAPGAGFLGALGVLATARWGHGRLAFIFSSLALAGIIATVGVSLFPFILPSSINLSSGLLIWDASSSFLTLLVMFISALIFIPLILIYTAWVYRIMRGEVNKELLEKGNQRISIY